MGDIQLEFLIDEFMTTTNKTTDVFLITKEFHTPTEFSQYIEKYAKNSKSTCWDILTWYCISNDIEPESINKLINLPLKQKIEAELLDLNLIKGNRSNKLPF